MRNLRFIPIFLITALLLSTLPTLPAAALVDPSPGAEFVVIVETTSDQVLYERNPRARAYPASLTKIMTVMLACEAINAGEVSASDIVVASENARFDLTEDSSTANIVPGESMAFQDLLYCALVKSANEACNIIAEHVAGSIPAFVQRMNDRARELGCTGTLFANTHGMPDEGHYTTAWDMYLIMEAAIDYPLFVEISGTKKVEIPATNLATPRVLENTNALLGDSDAFRGYSYEYAKGGKTGHTSAAGHCLASYAAKNNIELIAIVMKAETVERDDGTMNYGHFSDSILLYNWAFENFSYQEVIKQTEVIATLPVAMGSDSNTVSLRPERSVSVLLPNDTDALASFDRTIVLYNEATGEQLQAPIQAGEVFGEITLTRENVDVTYTIPLVATGSVNLSKAYYMTTQIKEVLGSGVVRTIVTVLIILAFLYIIIVVRYRVLRMRHRNSVRRAKRERAAREREGYSSNEYYATTTRRERAPIDHFDETDYYEGQPIGWTGGQTAAEPEYYDEPEPDVPDNSGEYYYEEDAVSDAPEEYVEYSEGYSEEYYDESAQSEAADTGDSYTPEAAEPEAPESGEKSSDRDFYEEFFK